MIVSRTDTRRPVSHGHDGCGHDDRHNEQDQQDILHVFLFVMFDRWEAHAVDVVYPRTPSLFTIAEIRCGMHAGGR